MDVVPWLRLEQYAPAFRDNAGRPIAGPARAENGALSAAPTGQEKRRKSRPASSAKHRTGRKTEADQGHGGALPRHHRAFDAEARADPTCPMPFY